MGSPDAEGQEGGDRSEVPAELEMAPRRSMALKDKLRAAVTTGKPTRASFCMNLPRDSITKQVLSEVIVPIVPGMPGQIVTAALTGPQPRGRTRRSHVEGRKSRFVNTTFSDRSSGRLSGSEDFSPRARRASLAKGQDGESTRRESSGSEDAQGKRRRSDESRGSRGSVSSVVEKHSRESHHHHHHHTHTLRSARKEHAILHHRDSVMDTKKRATMAVARLSQKAEHRAMVRPSAAGMALAARAAAAAHASAIGSAAAPRRRRKPRRGEHGIAALQRPAEKARPQPHEDVAMRALKRLVALEGCSDRFFSMLANSCERLHLRAGATREVSSSRIAGAQRRPAVAVLVEKGTVRIEAGGMLIDEIGPGCTFGLANVMASVSGNTTREGLGIATEFLLRSQMQSDGCHCVLFTNVAFRQALTECPEDKARLFGLLHMVSRNDDTRRILATLQCGEAMTPAIANSLTRYVNMPGDVVIQEGRRTPDGLVLLRSGTLQVEMGGVMVRRVYEGQVLGEEMMFSVCQKWATSARCVTPCDIQILHRRLFLSHVRGMHSGNSEEEVESQRLLVLLEGRWKEDRAILSWPLFRGYETHFISALARLMETRVVLPGVKVWENGTGHQEGKEVALYFILHGSCEEEVMSQRTSRKADDSAGMEKIGGDARTIKRILAPGTCMAEREFLGLQEANTVVVKAWRLCLVAVLHRSVFLRAVDAHPSELQSEEVKRLLEQELDSTEPPLVSGLHEKIIRGLPLFRGCDRRFVERLCEKVTSRYFIGGQLICKNGMEAKAMLIVARGEVLMTLAGLEIRRYVRGKALNILALSEHFTPAYALICERACEVWNLAREEFTAAVDAFPLDRRRLSVLLGSEGLSTLSSDVSGGRSSPMPNLEKARPTTAATNDVLDKVEVLSGCSPGMMRWVRAHLETTVCFPDEVIYREGSEDESMYVICSGMVIVQGMKDNSQVSLSRGATFGEQRLLEVIERARATVTAVEITVLQVLHRSVLVKGLELFPGDASHFDRVAVSWLDASDGKDLAQAPLFSSCSADFLTQVSKFVHMRLVHKGGVVNEVGPAGESLCILRSGAAVAEERAVGLLVQPARGGAGQPRHEMPRRFAENSAVNADVVLGLIRRPGPLIRAERVCIVAEILAVHVMTALQRYPQEVKRMVQSAAGGTLWPSEVESVPFFRGMGLAFFSRLMEVSEWVMFLPDQTVVKQNGTGNVLFLLCYGVAVTKVDGMVVGHPLSSGDVAGTANFLRVSDKYRTTVRTQSVCHFRTLGAWHLDKVLPEHAAERERVEILRQQVQQNLSKEERTLHLQASREKLKFRADGAFRRHIGVVRRVRRVSPSNTPRPPPVAESGAQEDIPLVPASPAKSDRGSRRSLASEGDSGTEVDPEESRPRRMSLLRFQSEDSAFSAYEHSEESDGTASSPRQRRRSSSGSSSRRRRGRRRQRRAKAGRPVAPAAPPPKTRTAAAAHRGRWLFKPPKGAGAGGASRASRRSSSSSAESGSDTGSGRSSFSSSSEQWGRSSGSSADESSSASSSAVTKDSDALLASEDYQSAQARIAGAITDYTEGKKQAFLKARVLRLYHSGMPLDGTTRSTARLASPELNQLEGVLPPLVPREPPPGSAKGTKMTSDEKERLLHERFQELTSAPSSTALPRAASKRPP